MEAIVESIFTFLENNPWLFVLITVSGLVGMFWSKRQLAGLDTAKFVAEGGQYLRLPDQHISEAIEDADKKGNKEEFLALLRQIRREHGHYGVKVGHLYWIWNQIDKGETEVEKTPSFVNEEFESDLLRVAAFEMFLDKISSQPKEARDRISKEVIDRREKRESELNKKPLSPEEITAVFNEVLDSNGIEVIAESELKEATSLKAKKSS